MSYVKGVQQASISSLIRQVELSEICLPDFQRDFVWNPSQMALLLESVIRQYPIGTFLFLDATGNSSLGRRSFFGSDTPVPNARSFVIDGQQRIRTFVNLLRAPLSLETHDPFEWNEQLHKVYISIETRAENLPKEVDKPSFVVVRRTEQENKDDFDWQRQHRLMPVEFLLNDMMIAGWAAQALGSWKETTRQKVIQRMRAIGKRVATYECPIEIVAGRLDPQDHANMFRLLNEAGTDLTTFDLLVARLNPERVNLRELWREARAKYSAIDGFDLDPVQILKVHALIAQCRNGEANPTCRKRDLNRILENYSDCADESSPMKEFAHDWRAACLYLDQALRMLQHDFGVIRKKYMPYTPMLVTLAATLWWLREERGYQQKTHALMIRRIRRWYWGAVFSRDYQSRSDNVISEHFSSLRKWLQPKSKKTPSDILYRFTKSELEHSIEEIESGGDARYKALLCLPLAEKTPRDIHSEEYLDGKKRKDIQDHHIYPAAHLRRQGFDSESRNCVVNRMLITRKTNHEISHKPPHVYLAGSNPKLLRKHLLPPETTKGELDYRTFLKLRKELIVRRLWQFLS